MTLADRIDCQALWKHWQERIRTLFVKARWEHTAAAALRAMEASDGQ